jgi:hypothetical protein
MPDTIADHRTTKCDNAIYWKAPSVWHTKDKVPILKIKFRIISVIATFGAAWSSIGTLYGKPFCLKSRPFDQSTVLLSLIVWELLT